MAIDKRLLDDIAPSVSTNSVARHQVVLSPEEGVNTGREYSVDVGRAVPTQAPYLDCEINRSVQTIRKVGMRRGVILNRFLGTRSVLILHPCIHLLASP